MSEVHRKETILLLETSGERVTQDSHFLIALLGKLKTVDMGKATEFALSYMTWMMDLSVDRALNLILGRSIIAITTSQLHQTNSDLLGRWLCE